MTPPDAVHHVYIVMFSTLVPSAKLQSGVSLAVLWRGVSELSVVSDTEHCLRGTNLWLPSGDFLKEFVKSRNENTIKSSNWNWIRRQDIFATSYHIQRMEDETRLWGTSKHKQTLCETRKEVYGCIGHTGQSRHYCSHPQSQRSNTGPSVPHSLLLSCGRQWRQTKTRRLVNSYEMKPTSRVFWYRYTEWLRREGNSQIRGL
jgi:hypothetical protein